ncbi:hypothetical protein AAHE18_09G098500 [Arachis hypogaea]
MNSLLQIFHTVWRWDESERSESRRVWLECFGVPLHVWTVDTFKKIGGQWGEVVGCDTGIKLRASFSVGRVLIDTYAMDVINEWIHITLGTSGFDVMVKEVGQKVYSSQYTLEKRANKGVVCGLQNNETTRAPDADATTSSTPTKLIGYGDHSALLVTKRLRQEVEDEARSIILESILNEWSYDHLKLNQRNLVTNQQIYGHIDGLAEFVGLGESNEIDSELTIPWSYTCDHNGLIRDKPIRTCVITSKRATNAIKHKNRMLGQGSPNSLSDMMVGTGPCNYGLDHAAAGRGRLLQWMGSVAGD